MLALVLFPDHNVFPAQDPVRAEAAPRARGWQGWRSLEMPRSGDRRLLPLSRERCGSWAGDPRYRGRLRAPGPARPGRPRLQHQGQRAGSRERRGRTELSRAEAPDSGTTGVKAAVRLLRLAWDRAGLWAGTAREGHGVPALPSARPGWTPLSPLTLHSACKQQRRTPESSAPFPGGVLDVVYKPRFCCPWNKAITSEREST